MAKVSIQNVITRGIFRIVGSIDDSTAQPSVTISPVPKKQVDNTPGNDTFLDEIGLIVSADQSDKIEQMFLTSGVDNGDGTATYTATVRGILNSETANPPGTGYSRNYNSHENDALCLIDWTWVIQELNASYVAASSTLTAAAGEALSARNSVSLHTDGKLYKYHSTNYPNLVGIVDNAYAVDVTATYYPTRSVSSGHSGLTVGALQYAENTGTITETSSGTTKVLGQAISASQILVFRTANQNSTFFDNAFVLQDETDNTKEVDYDIGSATTGKKTTLKFDHTDNRTITFPDATCELIGNASGVATISDDFFRIDGGSGHVIFDASALTANRTITMPDANVDLTYVPSLVSKAVVDVTKSGDQSITSATDVLVTSWTEQTDNGSDFASNLFTAPVTGLYKIRYQIYLEGAGSTTLRVRFAKNTSTVIGDTFTANSATAWNWSGEFYVSLAASDTVGLYAARTVGSGTVNVKAIGSFPTAFYEENAGTVANNGTRFQVEFISS